MSSRSDRKAQSEAEKFLNRQKVWVPKKKKKKKSADKSGKKEEEESESQSETEKLSEKMKLELQIENLKKSKTPNWKDIVALQEKLINYERKEKEKERKEKEKERKEKEKERKEKEKERKEKEKERGNSAEFLDLLWQTTWQSLSATRKATADIKTFFQSYTLAHKECTISKLEQFLKTVKPFEPLQVNETSLNEHYYKEASSLPAFGNEKNEHTRYNQVKTFLEQIVSEESGLKINTFDDRGQGASKIPDSFIYERDHDRKGDMIDQVCTIEVKKFIGTCESQTQEEKKLFKPPDSKDEVTCQLITRCFQRGCPSRASGSDQFPWVGLFFDHFRVGAVVIYHKDHVSEKMQEFAKPLKEKYFPVCVIRTKTYFYAGDGPESDFRQAVHLVRTVVGFGREIFKLRANAKPLTLSGPEDRSGFYIPSGDRNSFIPLKIQSIILNTNHRMGVVATPLGEKWIFKRDPLTLPWSTHVSTLAREAKILQYLESRSCPNIPKVQYFGDDHRGKEVLITSPFGYPIRLSELPLSTKQIQQIVVDVTSALRKMQENGVVHGDVSLNNIVWKSDHRREAMLIDFGTSNFVDQTSWNPPHTLLTCSIGSMLGSPPTPIEDFEALLYVIEYLATGTLPWKEMPPEDQLEAKVRFLKQLSWKESNSFNIIPSLPLPKIIQEADKTWNAREDIRFQSTWHALRCVR